MDYNGLLVALQDLLVIPSGEPNWAAIQEALMNDAEGRIYKDMNFLGIRQSLPGANFTTNNRVLAVPARMIICEQVAWQDGQGSTNPLLFTSLDFINMVWPQQATPGDMQYWALLDDRNIVVGGTPGGAYPSVFTGKVRPVAMSAANQNSYIGDNHPELLVAACMVFAIGYQRDFGSMMALNPQMGLAWESVYQSRLKSSREEELRKMTAGQPPPLAPAVPPQPQG